jgi:hypothetical protein
VLAADVVYQYNNNRYMWAGAGNYSQALAASEALVYNGSRGHLLTVTGAGEMSFLKATNLSVTGAYVGASESAAEKRFSWSTGPDKNLTVSAFWNANEPNNNAPGGEDCVEIIGPNGWNDVNCGTIRNWIIEFEG